MAIFIAEMPRSGSMWTYNVIHALLEASGISSKEFALSVL